MSALDSSCSGMLLMSDEKGLRGFSRLMSQLVLPGEDGRGRFSLQAALLTGHCPGMEAVQSKGPLPDQLSQLISHFKQEPVPSTL